MEHCLVGKLWEIGGTIICMIKINIANDFTTSPGGRFKKEGDNSGELFRETILYPKYQEAKEKGEKLEINLDGCMGYPSSFIDESFGGLSRLLKDKSILDTMTFISNDQPSLVEEIKECVIKDKKNEH